MEEQVYGLGLADSMLGRETQRVDAKQAEIG